MEAAELVNTFTCAGAHRPAGWAAEEARRDVRYPLSRWYLRPAAGWLAAALATSPVRPNWLSVAGLLSAAAGAWLLVWRPELGPCAALLVLVAWFFDRCDGRLARLQGTASPLGAWIDANIDELEDVGLHVAVAAAASVQWAAAWPWGLLIAFLMGKYLLMYGLAAEEGFLSRPAAAERTAAAEPAPSGWLATAYHLPGNADVRVHLLVACMACGWLVAELALVAAYYNFRWLVRYALVARRWGGSR
jgi:phosphatidylglycerophosphate synthase